MPRPPRLTDIGCLVLREHLGVIFIDANGARDGRSGLFVVAGHHHDLADAAGMKRADRVGRLSTQRIGDADHCRQNAGNRQIEMRAFAVERHKRRLFPLGDAAALVLEDEMIAADDDLMSLDRAGNAVRHDVFHAGMIFLVVQAAPPGLLDHGVGQRMRIVLLETRGQTQHIILGSSAEGHDLRHTRLGIGERAGLVKDDGIRPRDRLKEAAALDRRMMLTALAHGRKHGDRHGELERAGEVHHQHGEHFRHVTS